MSKLLTALQGVQAPKVSLREIQGSQYQAVNVQETRKVTSNPMGELLDIAQGATKLYGDYQARREAQGQERKNEIMLKNMRPEEIGKLRQDGILLYQDDPYAMRALEKELGRQEAYNVDAVVAQRIRQGDYNTRQEMEADRSKLMSESMKTMGATYGMPDGGTQWFNAGYSSDMTDRNMSLYNAMALKQDEVMRNESRLVVENNLSDIVSSSTPPQGVIEYLNSQRAQGVIRNDGEYEQYLNKALSNAATRPDAVDAVESLMSVPVTIDGKETTMRARLGEEAYQAYKLKAVESKWKQDWESQKWFTQQIDFISNLTGDSAEDFEKGTLKVMELEKYLADNEGAELTTQHKMQLEQAKMRWRDNLEKGNVAKKKALMKDIQQKNRLLNIRTRAEQALSGEAVPLSIGSFAETELTGQYTSNDMALFFEEYASEISGDDNLSPAEKQAKYLKMGKLFKATDNAGFGAWYTAQMGKVEEELQAYDLAAQYGQELPETPTLNTYKSLYSQDPQGFMEMFGNDAKAALDISIMAQMNIDPATYRKGAKALASMTMEERQFKSQEWMTAIDKRQAGKIIDRIPQADQQAYMAFYAGLDGLGNSAKMKAIEEHVAANYIETDFGQSKGVVRRELLMLDPASPKSAEEGRAVLENFVTDLYGSDGFTAVSSSGNNIVIRNATGSMQVINREILLQYRDSKK